MFSLTYFGPRNGFPTATIVIVVLVVGVLVVIRFQSTKTFSFPNR